MDRLQKLTHLGVGRNELKSADYVLLNQCSQLISLSVKFNKILPPDAVTFAQNTTLRILDLSHNHLKFTHLQPLSENSTLKALNLSFNFNGEVGLEFVNLMQLTQLDVSYNNLKSGAGIFANNTTLRELVIGNNDVGNASLAAISCNSKLTYLDITYNFESGYGYTHGDSSISNWDALINNHCMLLRIDMSGYGGPFRNVDTMLHNNKQRFEDMAVLGYVLAKTIYTLAKYTNGYLPVQVIIAFMFGITEDNLPNAFKNRIINGVNFFNKKLLAGTNDIASTSTAESTVSLNNP